MRPPTNIKIDAVITWVNGDDPKHRAKREKFTDKAKSIPAGAKSTRFSSLGEIVFCILSIAKYASFINKIYIVTDNQIPSIFDALNEHFPEQVDKIKIVDHKVIFQGYEDHLPTFNSLSIESLLHRIPNLSENYIYFNDDFFLVRSCNEGDWFDGGKTILYGKMLSKIYGVTDNILSAIKDVLKIPHSERRISSKTGQRITAHLAGFTGAFFNNSHSPLAVQKSTLEVFFSKNPNILDSNISYRFRSSEQIIPITLSNHLDLVNGTAKIGKKNRLVYAQAGRGAGKKALQKISRIEDNPAVKFFCIQSLDEASPEVQKIYLDWLAKRMLPD
ncbi:MAG: Stealth CR1 domain-containing protein [Paracoccaceae bacterium]